MSHHTPGPWVTETNKWGETSVKSANDSDLAEWPIEYFIAEKIGGHVRGDDFSDFSEVRANANLIAAAPDLIEALDRLTKWAEVMAESQTCEHTGDHPIAIARAALIKAMTGESQ